jgi:hypothetical protein
MKPCACSCVGLYTENNMLDRNNIREALKSLGLKMTAKNEAGVDDYAESVYQVVTTIVTNMDFRHQTELVKCLSETVTGMPYQFVIAEQTDENNPFITHAIVPLDHQSVVWQLNYMDIVGNFNRLEELVEKCIYAAHEDMMAKNMWIYPPRDYSATMHPDAQIFSIQLGDLYAMRIWSYNMSLPEEHKPPRTRDEPYHYH